MHAHSSNKAAHHVSQPSSRARAVCVCPFCVVHVVSLSLCCLSPRMMPAEAKHMLLLVVSHDMTSSRASAVADTMRRDALRQTHDADVTRITCTRERESLSRLVPISFVPSITSLQYTRDDSCNCNACACALQRNDTPHSTDHAHTRRVHRDQSTCTQSPPLTCGAGVPLAVVASPRGIMSCASICRSTTRDVFAGCQSFLLWAP